LEEDNSNIARFFRDEIITGDDDVLTMTSINDDNPQEDVTSPIHNIPRKIHFQYLDVIGIELMDSGDLTESMTDLSLTGSSRRDDDIAAVIAERSISSAMSQDHVKEGHQKQKRILHNNELRQQMAIQAAEVPKAALIDSNKTTTLHKYMIKQVHPDCCSLSAYEKESQVWFQAITHLVRETKILQQFGHEHQHLLTLRGTPVNNEEVFLNAAAQWDSFFLLTDRISETLGQRIHRWRQEHVDRPDGGTDDKAVKPVKEWIHPQHVPVATSPVLRPASDEFKQKLAYAQNMASALAFLHSKQIIVRNLSPDSIGFLASDDTLQLMDVGQALQVDYGLNEVSSLTKPHIILDPTGMLQQQQTEALFKMTPGHVLRYMAPEVLVHLPSLKCCYGVDSYSWAMVCFAMFTLSEPFATLKPGQHLRHVCFQRPSRRPHLALYKFPKMLVYLLQKAWHEDVQKRIDMIQIDQKLQQMMSGTEKRDSHPGDSNSNGDHSSSGGSRCKLDPTVTLPQHCKDLPRSV